ncbi:hypothetical protein [uncultured Shewanella sp.]|uniref:hypothetical protein n=1 Tax=uncultured Shewanella sp. TaxID=173975 RepID=UPI00261EB805|nr:hypothetical protein [uncultured Shewanella sp.]
MQSQNKITTAILIVISYLGLTSVSVADDTKALTVKANHDRDKITQDQGEIINIITEDVIKLTVEDKTLAREYQLTDDEMKRYKYLVEHTPRKHWSPNIDPVTLLGIEAKNVNQQKHFAKKWISLQTARQKKEISFEYVKNQLLIEQYPNSFLKKSYRQIINSKSYAEITPKPIKSQYQKNRTVLFTDINNCNRRCQSYTENVIQASGLSTQLDIYVLNAASETNIENYIQILNISKDRIRDGSITLHRDKGEFNQLTLPNKQLPIAISNMGEQQKVIKYAF